MNKFQKRIAKNIKKSPIDCLIIGDGFMHLDDLIGMFKTVFLLDSTKNIKAKNLILRKDVQSVFDLRDIGGIFVDLSKIEIIDSLSPLLSRSNPDVFIEGNDVIERQYSKTLYQLNYRAIAQLGYCHQWSVNQ